MKFKLGRAAKPGEKILTDSGWKKIKSVDAEGVTFGDWTTMSFWTEVFGWGAK